MSLLLASFTNRREASRRFARLRELAGLLLCTIALSAAVAQPPPPPPDEDAPTFQDSGRRPHHPPHDRPPGPPPDDFGPDGPPPGGPPRADHGPPVRPLGFLRRFDHPFALFRPLPSEEGPLAEGEFDELLGFADEKIPRLANLLRARSPHGRGGGPPRGLARELIPALRQLRRIFAEDPALGELHRRHWTNFVDLRRLRHAYQRTDDVAVRTQVENQARTIFADMIAVELKVAEHELSRRQADADAVASARVEMLLQSKAEPAAEPPPIRDLLREYREAETDSIRTRLRAHLRDKVARAIELETKQLGRLVDHLKRDPPAEVDWRIERFISDDGPPWGRPKRPWFRGPRDAEPRLESESQPADRP